MKDKYYTAQVSDKVFKALKNTDYPFLKPFAPVTEDDVYKPYYASVLDWLMSKKLFISVFPTYETDNTGRKISNNTEYMFCLSKDTVFRYITHSFMEFLEGMDYMIIKALEELNKNDHS